MPKSVHGPNGAYEWEWDNSKTGPIATRWQAQFDKTRPPERIRSLGTFPALRVVLAYLVAAVRDAQQLGLVCAFPVA